MQSMPLHEIYKIARGLAGVYDAAESTTDETARAELLQAWATAVERCADIATQRNRFVCRRYFVNACKATRS